VKWISLGEYLGESLLRELLGKEVVRQVTRRGRVAPYSAMSNLLRPSLVPTARERESSEIVSWANVSIH
jgi:hypothetical protein